MVRKNMWLEKFEDFFKSGDFAHEMSVVLEASSVRELWLQGELLLHFTKKINALNGGRLRGNDRPIEQAGKGYSKADFAGYTADGKLDFLGELKVLGLSGYLGKCFCGHQGLLGDIIKKLENEGSLTVSDTDEWRLKNKGYLLADYFRLVDYPESITKALFLVLETRGNEINNLGRVLQSVNFGGKPVFNIAHPDFMVKAWLV